MPAEATQDLLTADELLDIEIPGKWTELIRGRLVVREPPGTYHGVVSANLAHFVSTFVRQNRLGLACGQDTGFKIESNPDTVRAPDLAFIAKDRMTTIALRGYAALAPDLVAEVVSHNDRRGELVTKVGHWLAAGALLVWLIDPGRIEAQVYRPDGSITIVGKDGVLEGEDVLPGFTCSLSDVLDTHMAG